MTVSITGSGNLTTDRTLRLNDVSMPSVSWSSVVSANVTANANYGYAVNTAAGAFSVNLPATANVGDSICILDYGSSAAVNNITINPNGNKIQGLSSNSYISTNRASFRIVYIDSTRGWMVQNSATVGLSYPVSYLVVAGGGGGGNRGAGGAGGYRTGTGFLVSSGTSYTVTVGTGGPLSSTGPATKGNDSVFSSITSTGGGYGGGGSGSIAGGPGGSGGGGHADGGGAGSGGPGNTPSTTPSQGNNGGTGAYSAGTVGAAGGGGGAGAVGGNGSTSAIGGAGGAGTASSITGASVTYAGGGGGACGTNTGGGTGGAGGSGGGGAGASGPSATGVSGTTNTGGGGGGTATVSGGNGGSGVVIVSYPSNTAIATGGTITSYSSAGITYQVHTFTTSGTFTA